MSLFVVRHQHDPQRCPATDFQDGARLLNHLHQTNAALHGVRIKAEAVLPEHSLVLIAEADDETTLREFLAPLATSGQLVVEPASTCAQVVAHGGCAALAAALPGPDAVDPDQACQEALDAGLVVHRAHPLNCETALGALTGGAVMPNARFYVRNHFQIPQLDAGNWRLHVGGLVQRPLSLTMAQLRALPTTSTVVTLECAGNGRSRMSPAAPGEQWDLGAVSTAEWTGVPMVELLDLAGLQSGARELVFRGADSGVVDGHDDAVHFERSLSVAQLRSSGAVLAYAMNGDPLPVHHGYPLRLVMPGWYAVASVKWLTDIEAVASPFAGHFQVERYHIAGEPVSLQQVRSLVIAPRSDQLIEPGDVAIRGVAWSGAAPIARVEVAVDDQNWQRATLVGDEHPHSWRWWELCTRLDRPGPVTVRARATDFAGRTQPERAEWNALGYCNNVVHEVRLTVASEQPVLH